MKKHFLIGLGAAALLSLTSMTAFAMDPIKTQDGLMEITLPAEDWYQIQSDENTEMFSDGDCAILINLYKNGETLPAIESADAHHELIYTAAASTQDYILHVVGYAHERADFSDICKSINSIKVDDSKITESMLDHTVVVEDYGIADMNYTAWVAADELNVRSTSEDGAIITTLSYGDKVTVTGSVLKNGMEIGWLRIKTEDGTEGYVSSQFISTTVVADEAPEVTQDAEKTATVVKVYDALSNVYYLTAYTDGTFRTEDGKIFWQDRHGNFVDGGSLLLSYEKPNGGYHRTGYSMTVYTSDGTPTIIYQYTNGQDYAFYDDYFNVYSSNGGDYNTWVVNNGEWLVTLYDPTAGQDVEYATPADIHSGEAYWVRNDAGEENYIVYDPDINRYVDEYGNYYDRYDTHGNYMDEYGTKWHVE